VVVVRGVITRAILPVSSLIDCMAPFYGSFGRPPQATPNVTFSRKSFLTPPRHAPTTASPKKSPDCA